jgi:hypothetical protein
MVQGWHGKTGTVPVFKKDRSDNSYPETQISAKVKNLKKSG